MSYFPLKKRVRLRSLIGRRSFSSSAAVTTCGDLTTTAAAAASAASSIAFSFLLSLLGRRPSDPSTRAPPPAAILNLFPGRRGISPPPPREPISPIMAPTIPTSQPVGRLNRVDGRRKRHYHLTPSSVRPSERRTSRRSSLSCQSRSIFAGPASLGRPFLRSIDPSRSPIKRRGLR